MATKNETTTPSTAKQVNILGSKVLFKGRWLQFSRTSYIDEGDGTTVREYECIDRTTRGNGVNKEVDGVDMVPILMQHGKPDCLVMAVQFRAPVQAYTLEFPAGLINQGETPEEAAKRELLEEVGFHGTILQQSPVIFYDTSISSDNGILFVMKIDADAEINKIPKQKLDEDEHIGVILVPISQFSATIEEYAKAGYKIDAKVYGIGLGMQMATIAKQ